MRRSAWIGLMLLGCPKASPPAVQGQAHVELLRAGPVRTAEGPTPDTATRLSVCPALQGLQIQSLQADDQDGDGRWRAGERLTLRAAVVNAGAVAALSPALTVDGLPVGFSVPLPTAGVPELEPGAPALLSTHIDAAAELAVPRTVELQLRLTDARAAACPGVDGLLLRVEVD
jgi:hypothetical protein